VNLAQTFAGIAAGFSSAMGAPFVDAVATWTGDPEYDNGGSIVLPGVAEEYDCKAQFDAPTQAMRASDDFLQTDVRILVLAASIARPLDTFARITVASGDNAGTWSLISCQRDAAGIGFDCQGRRINDGA